MKKIIYSSPTLKNLGKIVVETLGKSGTVSDNLTDPTKSKPGGGAG